jgi:hypothetical protein
VRSCRLPLSEKEGLQSHTFPNRRENYYDDAPISEKKANEILPSSHIERFRACKSQVTHNPLHSSTAHSPLR